MKVSAKIDDKQIREMGLTISFTMTVEEWRALMSQQPNSWPSNRIGTQISSVLGHVARATEVRFIEPEETT